MKSYLQEIVSAHQAAGLLLDEYNDEGENVLSELCDRQLWNEALSSLNAPWPTYSIINALYISLALWEENHACCKFIDRCIKLIGVVTPSTVPSFLKNIIIGGAYPYLIAALKSDFSPVEKDKRAIKEVDYGSDLNNNENWIVFVEWVKSNMNSFLILENNYITCDMDDELIITGNVKRRFLKSRGFNSKTKSNDYRDNRLFYSVRDWKKKFIYHISNSPLLLLDNRPLN